MAWDEEALKLQEAGFSSQETQNIAYGIAQRMQEEGHTPDQFDEFFGKPPVPDTTEVTAHFNKLFTQNMPPPDEIGKEKTGGQVAMDAVKAGLENSVLGLRLRGELPKTELDKPSLFFEGAPWYDRLLEGATQGAIDAPLYVANTLLTGGIAGGMALTGAERAMLMKSYQQGGVHNFSDFLDVATSAGETAAKEYAVGKVTSLASGVATAATQSAEAGAVTSFLAPTTASAVAMTTAESVMNKKIPTLQEISDNAILMGAFHAVTPMKDKLMGIYQETGVHPAEVSALSMNDPVLRQEVLASDSGVPESLKPLKQPVVKHSEFAIVDGKLVPAEKAAAQGEFNFKGTPSEFVKSQEARFTPEERMNAAKAHDPIAFKAMEKMSAQVKDANQQMKYLLDQEEAFRQKGVKTEQDFIDHKNRVNQMEVIDKEIDRIKNNSEIKARMAEAFQKGQKTLESNLKDRIKNAVIEIPDAHEAKVPENYNPEFTDGKESTLTLTEDAKDGLIENPDQYRLFMGENEHFTKEDAIAQSLKNHPELAEIIAPEIVQKIPSKTEGGKPTLVIGPRTKQKSEPLTLDRFISDVMDNLYVLENRINKVTRSLIGKFPISADPRAMTLRSRAFVNRARVMIGVKNEKANSAYGVFDYHTKEKVHDSWFKVMSEIPEKRLEDFRFYRLYKQIIQDNRNELKTGVDNQEALDFVAAHEKEFEATNKKVVSWNNAVLKYGTDGGLESKENYDRYVSENPDYAPSRRLTEDMAAKGGIFRKKIIFQKTGSELPYLDPMTADIEKALNINQRVEENDSVKALVLQNELRPEDDKFLKPVKIEKPKEEGGLIATQFERNSPTNRNLTPSQIGYFDKGLFKVVDTGDPMIAQALTEMRFDPAMGKLWGSLYYIPKKLADLDRWAAISGPDFSIRHTERSEIFTYLIEGNVPFARTLLNLGKTFGKNSDAYVRALKSGAFDGVIYDTQKEIFDKGKYNMTDSHGVLSSTWNTAKSIANIMHLGLQLGEEAKRIGVNEKLLAKNPSATFQEQLEAGWKTRQSSVDGLQVGLQMRALNGLTALQSYQIQGMNRLLEAWRENPKGMAFRSSVLAAASAALWFATKDDQAIQNLPMYQKLAFWNFKVGDKVVPIAKPWEEGQFFGSMVERSLDLWYRKNPRAFDGFGDALAELVPLSPPSAFSDWNALHNNFNSLTDRQIIPDHYMGLVPEQRAFTYTTDTSRLIAKALGPVPGSHYLNLDSPIMVDFAARRWSGQLGRLAMQGTDALLQKAHLAPPSPRLPWELADVPFIGALIARQPTYNAQPLKDFDNEYKKAEQLYNTYKNFDNSQGHEQEAMDYLQKYPEINYFSVLQDAHKEIHEQIKTIQNYEIMPPSIMPAKEKKAMTELLWKTAIARAKSELDNLDSSRKNIK